MSYIAALYGAALSGSTVDPNSRARLQQGLEQFRSNLLPSATIYQQAAAQIEATYNDATIRSIQHELVDMAGSRITEKYNFLFVPSTIEQFTAPNEKLKEVIVHAPIFVQAYQNGYLAGYDDGIPNYSDPNFVINQARIFDGAVLPEGLHYTYLSSEGGSGRTTNERLTIVQIMNQMQSIFDAGIDPTTGKEID